MKVSKKQRKLKKKKLTRVANKKKHYSRKYKLGGTGVLIKDGSNAAKMQFLFFIENSTLVFQSNGANGVTVLATLKPGLVSPYTSMDSTTYGNPINKIIIKFIIISIIPEHITLKNGDKIDSTILNSVTDEVNIQTDVALKTMNYLEPISPSPLYFDANFSYQLLNDTIKPRIVDNMSRGQELLKKCINDMATFIQPGSNDDVLRSISVIGMEFAEGYESLWSLRNDPNFNTYVYMTAYILIKLAVETGYAHGDYHKGNIMINNTKNTYFEGLEGAPLLIDYGLSTKIQPNTLNRIRELYNAEIEHNDLKPENPVNPDKYTQILEILSKIPRKDGAKLTDLPDFYGYICDICVNNRIIDGLFKSRDKSIKNTITLFEGLHTNDPSKYPLLPLPNSIKNKMYSGVDIRNKVVTSKLEFTPRHLFSIKRVFEILYEIIMRNYSSMDYSLRQKRCFYIIGCYNFVYILNNSIANNFVNSGSVENAVLYSLIGLLFIEKFNIEYNKNDLDLFEFIKDVTNGMANNRYFIINKIKEIYPLFDGKKVNSEYAPIFANMYDTKEEFVSLMLDPRTYSNPLSLLQFVGPKVRPEVETHEFPFDTTFP
jgi:hypothetical protein